MLFSFKLNLQPVPSGMYKLLMWINKEYNNPPVIVTENGVSDNNGVEDRDRVNYFNSYLSAVLDALVSLIPLSLNYFDVNVKNVRQTY